MGNVDSIEKQLVNSRNKNSDVENGTLTFFFFSFQGIWLSCNSSVFYLVHVNNAAV